jgi:hypothetical protein
MNDRRPRLGAVWLLAVTAAALTLVLATYGPSVTGQPGPSPVSPVTALPWVPTPEPAPWWERVLHASFWISPLPWVAVGLVLFGALAGVLVRALRRVWPAAQVYQERSDPPGRTPRTP